MKIPFSNDQLRKIATYGAVFVGGNAVLMHYLVQKRFHESPFFTAAASAVLSHQPLVNHLGEPVVFGNPDLSNKTTNFSTESEAQFELPIKGSRTSGTLRFSTVKAHKSESVEEENRVQNPWNLTSLEVTVDDRPNQKIVLVRKVETENAM